MDQAERLRTMFQDTNDKPNKSPSSRIITITSGKGGVGKTNITVNIAIQLSKLGKKVVILDADLGLANIELLMGITPKYSLEDVIKGSKSIEQVFTSGPFGINFISGGSGVKELIRISDAQLDFFIRNLNKLDRLADIILIDTGAGLSNSVMSFVKAVNEVILVATPDPTAIMDAYSLIKLLKNDLVDLPKINIIINKVYKEQEGYEAFNKLFKVSDKFLEVPIENLGYVPYDTHLVKAVKSQNPVIISYPKATSSKAFERLANRLLNIPYNNKGNKSGIDSFIKRLISNSN